MSERTSKVKALVGLHSLQELRELQAVARQLPGDEGSRELNIIIWMAIAVKRVRAAMGGEQ